MNNEKYSFILIVTACLLAALIAYPSMSYSQDYKDQVKTEYFDRGINWNFIDGLAGGTYDSFVRRDHQFDFPGFEPDIVQAENIGTFSTHLCVIGFAGIANRVPVYPGYPSREENQFTVNATRSIWGANTDMGDSTQQMVFTKAIRRWRNGENYFLKTDPLEAEEVYDASVTFNTNYRFPAHYVTDDMHHVPMRIELNMRTWSGSRRDQCWYIYEYTFTNITDDPAFKEGYWANFDVADKTMYDFNFIYSVGAWINYRSSRLIGQGWSRDDQLMWDPAHNMVIQLDGDYKEATSPEDDTYDFYEEGGPGGNGEYTATGHLGHSLLYTTPNRDGNSAEITGYWASRYHNIGLGTESWYGGGDAKTIFYDLEKNTYNMIPSDWGYEAFHLLIMTGLWDIAPGESVKIVWFSGIGSVDLENAYGQNASVAYIATGLDTLKMHQETAQLAANMALVDGYASSPQYKGWNIPDVPAGPTTFSIDPYYGEVPGNVISWDDDCESIADPDYTGAKANDLAGYTVWRSDYLPFQGFRAVANITKGNANYYDASTGKYTFIDKGAEGDPSSIKVGFNYYYAISTYDTGHDTWPPRPEAFPDGVPPLESSLQSSQNYHFDISKWVPFRTLRAPGQEMSDIHVVPNPFVMQAGFTTPRDIDSIQFVGLPGQCTIRIYSVRGDLVQTLEHTDGSGTEVWDQRTRGEQFAESGIYIYHVESKSGTTKGQTFVDKFVVIR